MHIQYFAEYSMLMTVNNKIMLMTISNKFNTYLCQSFLHVTKKKAKETKKLVLVVETLTVEIMNFEKD